MKRALWLLMTLASGARAGNYAECILDNMPGTVNAPAAFAVVQSCTRDYPRQYSGVYKGVGLGLFGFKDAETCIIKKSRDTPQPNAAILIGVACRCMYEPPLFDKQLCSEYTPVQQ